mgnify:FL=1
MNKNKKDVGQTIKQIRKERGLSQDALSRKMGFKDHSALTKIETGINDINSEGLMELAKILNVQIGVFFTGKTSELPDFKVKIYDDSYRDDMIFMVLSAIDAANRIPTISPDLLDIKGSYFDKGDMFWVALGENNRVIGCIGYETIAPKQAKIHHLFIKPDLSRQGIGSALLDTLIKHISEKGYEKVSVSMKDERYQGTKMFYKAKKFIEIDQNTLEKEIQ